MLQDIRKSSQGITAKIVIGLIITTFALFGVDSIVGSIGSGPEVAEVNGEGIPESTYARALDVKKRQVLMQMGEFADPDLINEALLGASVLDGLIEQEVLTQDASEKDLFVPGAAIDRYISNIDQFKDQGVFSNDRMHSVLRGAGLTLKSYRDSLRTEFAITQPRSALIASSFILPGELSEVVALDRQARSFGFLAVSRSSYLESVVVSDEEVNSYYSENKTDFKKPQSVDVSFIEISQSDLLSDVSVTDEEVEALYESEREAYASSEERDASHVLIKIDESRSEAEALAAIKSVESRLVAGEEFAALAKELSDDEGSASSGGSLGAAARGVYVADFEDALFALKEGQVSAPVKTEFGYHLIRLDRIIDSGIPALAELEEKLKQRLMNEKVVQAYADLAERLADISYASSGLEEPSEELGLEIKQLVGVSVESRDRVFSSPKVQRQLFAEELLNDGVNSDLVEYEDGSSVVFRIDAFYEEGIKPFDEVAEIIRQKLVEDKAAEFAASVGQAFAARVAAGEEAVVVAEDMGFTWVLYEDLERNSADVDAEVLSKVFSMKLDGSVASSVLGFGSNSGDFNVVQLMAVKPGDATSLTEQEGWSVSKVLSESLGGVDYRSYRSVAQRKATIEKI
jgi:peptidyl-prolyl cis-trans isomerase D